MENIMDVVVKTINFIQARALNHRQFISFLSTMDSEYGEHLYHSVVRWLSRGNVLKRCFALREEIGLFLAVKGKDVPELCDPIFVSKLAFLTDLTDPLNVLNLKLQGPKQLITMMYDSVKSFKGKLLLWAKQLAGRNFPHFTALQSLERIEPQYLKEYADIILKLHAGFDRRFRYFIIRKVICAFCYFIDRGC